MSRSRRTLATLALALAVISFPLGALASHDFADVPDSNPFHADISALVGAGVTFGCGGGNYCPSANVTREQMAAFMNRLGALSVGKTPVVNADKLDGLDSAQFVRSDVVATGHFPCAGFAMTARGPSTTDILNGGKYFASGGNDQLTCNVTLPDGATVVAVRGRVYDNSATLQSACSLLAISEVDGLPVVMANTPTTGEAETPGYTMVEDASINQPVIDNVANTYVGQCTLTGTGAAVRVHGYWIEYTTSGVPIT